MFARVGGMYSKHRKGYPMWQAAVMVHGYQTYMILPHTVVNLQGT